MGFEDLFRGFWINNIQLSSKRHEMLIEILIRNDLLQLLIVCLPVRPLSAQHETQLFQGSSILTAIHDLVNHLLAVHLLSNKQGIGELLQMEVNTIGSLVELGHVLLVSCIGGT